MLETVSSVPGLWLLLLTIKVISTREDAEEKHSQHHPHHCAALNGAAFLLVALLQPCSGRES